MSLQPITYTANGTSFTGYLADGSDGRSVPGILVAHEGPGLTDHVKESAMKLADLGYVGFAMDIYGLVNPPLDEAKAMVQRLRADLPELRARGHAALDVLRHHDNVDATRLGAIGYCFGGTTVLELARSGADVACVVGFHAGLTTPVPEDAANIRGKVLVCQGVDDPVIDKQQRDAFADEMNAANVDWQMHLYGGVGHSFTNPEIDDYGYEGFAYNPTADVRSWQAMRNLFDEVFEAQPTQ